MTSPSEVSFPERAAVELASAAAPICSLEPNVIKLTNQFVNLSTLEF